MPSSKCSRKTQFSLIFLGLGVLGVFLVWFFTEIKPQMLITPQKGLRSKVQSIHNHSSRPFLAQKVTIKEYDIQGNIRSYLFALQMRNQGDAITRMQEPDFISYGAQRTLKVKGDSARIQDDIVRVIKNVVAKDIPLQKSEDTLTIFSEKMIVDTKHSMLTVPVTVKVVSPQFTIVAGNMLASQNDSFVKFRGGVKIYWQEEKN